MGDYTKGTIGTYTVTPEAAQRFNLPEGEELVFLPTTVDEAGAASGLAFTADGIIPVVIPAPQPEPVTDPNAKPEGVSTADWSAFRDFQAHRNDPPADTTPTPAAEPPADTTPANPSPFTFTTGGGLTTGDKTTTTNTDTTSENGDTK